MYFLASSAPSRLPRPGWCWGLTGRLQSSAPRAHAGPKFPSFFVIPLQYDSNQAHTIRMEETKPRHRFSCLHLSSLPFRKLPRGGACNRSRCDGDIHQGGFRPPARASYDLLVMTSARKPFAKFLAQPIRRLGFLPRQERRKKGSTADTKARITRLPKGFFCLVLFPFQPSFLQGLWKAMCLSDDLAGILFSPPLVLGRGGGGCEVIRKGGRVGTLGAACFPSRCRPPGERHSELRQRRLSIS